MGSQRSGKPLESFLEQVRFILTEYGPVPKRMDPLRPDFYDFRCNTYNDQDQGPRNRDQAGTRTKPTPGPSRPRTKPGPGTMGPSQAWDQAGPGTKPAQDRLGTGPDPKTLIFLKKIQVFIRRQRGGNPLATRRQRPGKDNLAPAHYLHNKNPSLVALGKKS